MIPEEHEFSLSLFEFAMSPLHERMVNVSAVIWVANVGSLEALNTRCCLIVHDILDKDGRLSRDRKSVV